MVDPTSQSRPSFSVDTDDRPLHRLWPRQLPTRRLVVLTLLGGSVLTILGILAFWQVIDQFSLINAQQQRQENASSVLKTLAEFDGLLREGTNQYVNLVRDHIADPTVDLSDARVQLTKENVKKIDAAIAKLGLMLNAIGSSPDEQRNYQQLKEATANYLLGRERMINEYLAEENQEKYYLARDGLQLLRSRVADYVVRLRVSVEPKLDEATLATSVEVKRTFLISCASLGGSGVMVLMLAWMLVRYVYQRDQTEADLRRTTKMWVGTLGTLKQGVAMYDYDQRLVLWNPRYAELNGIDPNRLYVGMPAVDVMKNSPRLDVQPPESELLSYDQHVASVKGGETVERELPRVDGAQMQLAFHPMGSDHFVVTLTDMTQIRKAEQLASDQAVRLGTIMNNVPDAIVTINASGSIESWNAAAEKMFGYAAAEIIHRNVSVLMNEPHASQHDYYLRRYLNEGDKVTLGRLREFSARRQDGREFPIDLRISEMQLGEKRMFAGIIRDITERRAVEQMKSEFISTVSHELRTPLTSIIGSLSLLTDGLAGELPDKVQRLIGMAEKNSQRLGRLINDILDLERAEAGRMALQLEVCQLQPLLEHSLEINQSYAARFDVSLRLKWGVAAVSVRVDEVRLLQVMANLLSNAIKHSPPQSSVLVEVTLTNEVVRVTVHDAGPGIAEEFKPRVFQRFAQADSSDTRLVAGSGLGLAITKQLIELHGGAIGFDTGQSHVGTGSGASFWFELPVVMAIPAAHNESELTGQLNMNLVLCEDDPDVAEIMSEILRIEGCNVVHVNRAASVRGRLNDAVSALLVDIDLPDGNGLNLIAELRREERWRKLPVLVVSGKRLTVDEQAALDGLCVSAWLVKPIDRSTLRAALRRINT